MAGIDLDAVLRGVSKPARYTGGEWNSLPQPWEAAAVRWALIYPDVYDLGMSNGGLAILYDALNHSPGTLAERCYAAVARYGSVVADARDSAVQFGKSSPSRGV